MSPPAIGAKIEEPAPAPARTRSGFSVRSLIIPVVTLLFGLGAGFGGAFFSGLLGAETVEEEPAEEKAEAATAHGAAPAAGGPDGTVTLNEAAGTAVTNLGALTVNLRGGAGGRVLRLEIQIETPADDAPGLALRSAQLRDSIITAVSDYTWSELEGAEGKTRLRDELISRVNGVVAPAAIGRLYFTQFVIQ